MGNKASRPARKLTKTIVGSGDVASNAASRVKLPTQELKDRFEKSASEPPANEIDANSKPPPQQQSELLPHTTANYAPQLNMPEGKDGMDPQADPNFINFINNLGRQIHSHSKPAADEANVRALKQLLNRKQLYEKGQDEVRAQMALPLENRTMIHPRTLTAILNALNDPNVPNEEILKDYQLDELFLRHMQRFSVAQNLVIIEEERRDDEIGPKVGQPVPRAATDPSMMDYNGQVDESVNSERLQKLRSRLE